MNEIFRSLEEKTMAYLLNRLGETSTWRGLFLLLVPLGLPPGVIDPLVGLCLGGYALLKMALPDNLRFFK